MTQSIGSAGGVGDHGQNPFHREPEHPSPHGEAASAVTPPDDTADVRLIIEDGQAGGDFVYTTVDHRTGAVIRQLPREGLLKLGEAPDYAAGALIRTKV